MTKLATRRVFLGGLAAVSAPTSGGAQGRTVRILVPFAPGGGADLIARLLSPHLSMQLGQSLLAVQAFLHRAGSADAARSLCWRRPPAKF